MLHQVVRGVSYPVWDQFGYQPGTGADAAGHLEPFRLVTDLPAENGQSTNDITHRWGPQHQCWDGGGMDGFVRTHVTADGAANGPVTMGYFTRADLPSYHALTDAFTVCDGYCCSVLGPTDPGDLTSTLRLSAPPVTSVPALPPTSIGTNTSTMAQVVLDALTARWTWRALTRSRRPTPRPPRRAPRPAR